MAKEESLKNEKSWSAKNVITMLLPPFTIVIFLSFRTLLKRTVAHVTAFSKISYHLAALVPKKNLFTMDRPREFHKTTCSVRLIVRPSTAMA
jgi:hypothetical protein